MPHMGWMDANTAVNTRDAARAAQTQVELQRAQLEGTAGVAERLDRIGPILDAMARHQAETNRLLTDILLELRQGHR